MPIFIKIHAIACARTLDAEALQPECRISDRVNQAYSYTPEGVISFAIGIGGVFTNTYLSHNKTMGINDRDYMRRPETEPADTPMMIARKGIILAACLVGGLFLVSAVIKRNAAEQEKEIRRQRTEEEQLRTQLQWAARFIRETRILDSEIKSEPPPLLRRLLNVNTASVEELDEVPNVSQRMAESIIENRPYKSMEDLDRAWGIGKPTIERLRFYLTVEVE